MELADRIEALWQAFRADSPDGARARRRAAAMAAMGTSVAVFLALVGLLAVVLVVAAVVASLAMVVAAALLVRRYGARLGEARAVVRCATDTSASIAASSKPAAARLLGTVSRARASARERVATHAPQVRDGYSRAQAATARQLATAATNAHQHTRSAVTSLAASATEAWPKRSPVVREREAVQANAAGVQLRREGSYPEAAEQHRVALALFRDLGDRRSEALTLNNLALALDRAGDATALELFEQAAAILSELGEEQHEGKVIANLGMAFRRRGREEQSAEVLDVALGKLDPESQEYRTVERLRRAS
jgi:tetratricopeptide (TPR) repeat protein